MAFQHGKLSGFHIEDSSTSLQNIGNKLNSIEISKTGDTAEVTTFNTTNMTKAYLGGLKDATISIEGKWDATIDGTLDGIVGLNKTYFLQIPSTDSSAADFVQYTGEAIMTGYSGPTASVDDAVTFTADFQLTGSQVRTAGST